MPFVGLVGKQAGAIILIQRHSFVGEVSDDQALMAGQVIVDGIDAHAGTSFTGIAEGNAGAECLISKRSVVVIVVKLVRLRVVGDEEVQPAVVVIIEQSHPQRFAGGIVETSFFRYIFKPAVAEIMKERCALAFVQFGRAVGFVLAIESAILVRYR